MLERDVERYLMRLVKAAGGRAAKLTIRGQRGWPDRLVALPGGILALVELKRPRKSALSPAQRALHANLARLGIKVHVPHTIEDVKDLMMELRHAQYVREAAQSDAGRRARELNDRDPGQGGQGVCEGGREEGASWEDEGNAEMSNKRKAPVKGVTERLSQRIAKTERLAPVKGVTERKAAPKGVTARRATLRGQ